MTMSSIIANVKITDPQSVEAFVDALEQSANEPQRELSAPMIPTLTDVDEIRKLMSKRFPDVASKTENKR